MISATSLECAAKKKIKHNIGKEKVMRNPVLIRYLDHVEFRNYNYKSLSPILRELVGWIVTEDEDHIVVLSERAASKDLEEIAKLKPSGFVILKSTVKEVIELEV